VIDDFKDNKIDATGFITALVAFAERWVISMKKGQVYEGTVTKVMYPNKGMVQVEGEDCPVWVKNVIEGQKVSVRIQKKRKGKAEGCLMEVLEKAENEIESPCPHFADCGGCTYQHLSYGDQLAMKERQVKELLDQVYANRGEIPDYSYEGIKRSPKQFGYRNKMEFSFGDEYKDGPLSLGMHKRGSFYDVVPVINCQIVDEDFRMILQTVLDFCRESGLPFYHRMKQEGYVRHLLVRKAEYTGEILIAIVTTSQMQCDFGVLVNRLCKLDKREDNNCESEHLSGRIAGILHTYNDSVADVVKNDHTAILYGRPYFTEKLLGLSFRISEFSFFQTNSLGAEVLYETVREYVGSLCNDGTPDKVVFDLYSGTGTIAQMLAPVSKKVIGVEIVEEAVEAAKENAKLNGLENCEFIAGDVLKVIDEIQEKPDFIVLDPPRDGIHPKALPKIIEFGVDRIVYISCKATSLARDLEVFFENGYRMEKAVTVDMFPGTVHVETVALLSKLSEAKHHIEVKVDMDELDLTSAEAKATYKEIQDWVQEKYGFHVTNLNIAQVKQKHGIIERENYNRPKSENSNQPGCPEEKVKAIEDAMQHFQMI
jgi:23S rRNA (uracil-5-)-methyltransferase RumA